MPRLSFEDLIKNEIESSSSVDVGGQALGGIDLKTIQALLKDVKAITDNIVKIRGNGGADAQDSIPVIQPINNPQIAANPPSTDKHQKAVIAYNQLMSAIDGVLGTFGDMALSELKTQAIDNKDAVIEIIEAQI